MDRFYASGKLLITSEYMVLKGALALALPTQLGQEFFVEEKEGNGKIFWNAYHQGESWLFTKIDFCTWEIIETNLPQNAEFILQTLKNIERLSPNFFEKNKDYFIRTNLQFPANFGLGSSSTLMTNLAKWSEVDSFALNEMSLGGSGYDIAVALENSPILYQLKEEKREIEKVTFQPNFKEDLIFIHLNQKQDSREGIQLFRSKDCSSSLIDQFSEITKSVLNAQSIEEFSDLMQNHEQLLSDFLGLPMVKNKFFSDCPTFVKSLGAWGGDFVMSRKFDNYENYFAQKGFNTIFSWQEMILGK